MKLKQLLEVRYDVPKDKPIPQPKAPEAFRTKHGFTMFLRGWKEKVREALWHEWMAIEHDSYDDFVQQVEGTIPQTIHNLYREVPRQFLEVAEETFSNILDDMRDDIEEEIANREEEDNW